MYKISLHVKYPFFAVDSEDKKVLDKHSQSEQTSNRKKLGMC